MDRKLPSLFLEACMALIEKLTIGEVYTCLDNVWPHSVMQSQVKSLTEFLKSTPFPFNSSQQKRLNVFLHENSAEE